MMEDLSLHILDIVENAVAAGATRVLVAVNENERRDVLTFRVTDNGRGMSRRGEGPGLRSVLYDRAEEDGARPAASGPDGRGLRRPA